MMKTVLLVMMLASYIVCCNVTATCKNSYEEDLSSTCSKEVLRSYLDIAIDTISKAKCFIPSCKHNTKIQLNKAADCADLLEMGNTKSGIYEVWPMNRIMQEQSVKVYCDMDTNGGGWTVVQRRGDFNNSKDFFYRNWKNYKEGFGNMEEEFWLGNDKIYSLTNQKPYSVRFDLKDVQQEKRYAVYDEFWIDDEEHNYTLHIFRYTGDAGDSMGFHNNQSFSTFDKDSSHSCAKTHKGGWWYGWVCHKVNLNGLYYKGKHGNENWDGTTWNAWKGGHESLEWTEIKIRPMHFRATFS